LDTDPVAVREQFVQHELDIVKKLHAVRDPFLAGTDTPAGVDVIPGFSLHAELQRLVDAGFTPLEALQTATINSARFWEGTRIWELWKKGKSLIWSYSTPIPRKIFATLVKLQGWFSRAAIFRVGTWMFC
jgi:hypothetical protein